jgi:subtilisin family serine protease
MTLTPGDDLIETARQRTRDQFALLKEAHGGSIIVDTDDPADFNFMCSADHVLLPPADRRADPQSPKFDPDYSPDEDDEDAVTKLVRWFEGRPGYGALPVRDPQPRGGLSRRFPLPPRSEPAPDGKDLLATLAEMDDDPELGPGFARPDHLMHICPKGTICPATEPAETGVAGLWPPMTATANAGSDVRVVVIDTGWYDPAVDAHAIQPAPANLPWGWLANPDVVGAPEPGGIWEDQNTHELRAYAGHGTFVAGVVRSMAPKCEITVLPLLIDRNAPGGGVLEQQLVDDLYDALGQEDLPDLMNMSAGCPTRLNLPSRSFEDWRAELKSRDPVPDLVLVAAAGNNSSPWQFWPASFSWATGVGSLDHDGSVSSFSNWGDSADVFALGRNLVNAFPNGTYRCHEAPDKHDERRFENWRARWSGTSFSAPLITGLIAAEISRQQPADRSAKRARKTVLAAQARMPSLKARQVSAVGSVQLGQP